MANITYSQENYSPQEQQRALIIGRDNTLRNSLIRMSNAMTASRARAVRWVAEHDMAAPPPAAEVEMPTAAQEPPKAAEPQIEKPAELSRADSHEYTLPRSDQSAHGNLEQARRTVEDAFEGENDA